MDGFSLGPDSSPSDFHHLFADRSGRDLGLGIRCAVKGGDA